MSDISTNDNYIEILIDELKNMCDHDTYMYNICPPIIRLASSGSVHLLQELLERGFDVNVNTVNDCDETVLMCSVKYPSVVRCLIDNGAELDTQDGCGNTALMWALNWDNINSFQMLLGAGSDIYIKNNKDMTVLDIAKNRNRDDIVELIEGMSKHA